MDVMCIVRRLAIKPLSYWLGLWLFCALSTVANADEALSTHSSAKQVLNWAINPGPPFHILNGPYQGQGVCDGLVDALTVLLPQFSHQKVVVPQGRVLNLLGEKNSKMCFPCMILRDKPPPGVLFSKSTLQFPRHVIITRSAIMPSAVPVRLADVLNAGRYRFGYPQGRRYGLLDPLIDSYKQQYPNLVLSRAGPGEADSVLSLIEIGRVDFTVDYPMVLKYHRLTRPLQPTPLLKTLSIVENLQQQPQQAVGCADNAWGASVVQAINQVIPQLQQAEQFQQVQKFWFDDGELEMTQSPRQ